MQELITTERLEWLCHKARCEEFAQVISELGYQPVSVVFGTIAEKISSIENQMIHSAAVNDPSWVTRAGQAKSIFSRKLKACRDRINAIRGTSLAALGGIDELQGSRLAMIKVLLGVLDRYGDSSKLSEEERAAINACRSAAGQTGDAKFGRYNYHSGLNAVLAEDRTEMAVISRHGHDREEIGLLFAASATMLEQIREALVDGGLSAPLSARMEATASRLS